MTTANQHDPVFKPRNRKKKCQQAAFNAVHLPTLSADVSGGLSERYYELLWMSCVLPTAADILRIIREAPPDDVKQTFRGEPP